MTSTAPTTQQIEDALKGYTDPYLNTDLVSSKAIRDIRVEDGRVSIEVELGFPAAGYRDELTAAVAAAVEGVAGVEHVAVEVDWKVIPHAVQRTVTPLPNVKNIIAVASGKGGVGKSTTAVNLAVALSIEGARVGLLDADIYGPSVPTMLGCKGKPDSLDGKTMEPKRSYDIQCISIGHLVDEETPMIWRGPMVTSALEQLLRDTNWEELDYMIVDLPPGTGDIQLTLTQRIPVSGAIIVTTPQDIALLDARKGLRMFEKVEVPVLGIIENMSQHVCSQCGHVEPIFGEGGGDLMAKQYGVELLGSLPLDIDIRQNVDSGRPSVALEPDSATSRVYRHIARRIAAGLALRAKDYSAKFPRIVIENE